MRLRNSVGGFRMYPTSPQVAELAERRFAIIGQFNEGMDRLNTQQQLTDRQNQVVNQLDPTSQLANKHQRLRAITNVLWLRAMETQQYEITDAEFVSDLSRQLNACANKWQRFKSQIEEQA